MTVLPTRPEITTPYGTPEPVAPGIVRLTANNPSPFTYKGTNTYLVGTRSLAVIDPGPEDPAQCAAILAAANGRPITHIFVTHAHRDHSDGAPALQAATDAPILGFGRRPGAARADSSRQPSGREFVDYEFTPDIALEAGAVVTGEDWQLTAVHTPGHAPDHLCLGLSHQRTLFSGDHVMSWNTTVIAPPEGRMSDYIRSLELLLRRRDRLYLPGHGERMERPLRAVKAYLVHRQWREQAILTAIRDGAETVPAVVARVYSGLDERLLKAAALSVMAHVEHLAERRLVACEPPDALDQRFSAL